MHAIDDNSNDNDTSVNSDDDRMMTETETRGIFLFSLAKMIFTADLTLTSTIEELKNSSLRSLLVLNFFLSEMATISMIKNDLGNIK